MRPETSRREAYELINWIAGGWLPVIFEIPGIVAFAQQPRIV